MKLTVRNEWPSTYPTERLSDFYREPSIVARGTETIANCEDHVPGLFVADFSDGSAGWVLYRQGGKAIYWIMER